VLSFAGPGLLIWLLAFHIPVRYPQETMAPYVVSTPAAMRPGPAQAHALSNPDAPGARRGQPPGAKRTGDAAPRS
jgi:hypothetical protein